MINSRTRNIILALAASAGFAGVAVAPAVSQAQPVGGAGGGKECLFHINSDGTVVTVADGETVRSPSGRLIKCNNGTWEVVGLVVAPIGPAVVSHAAYSPLAVQ
jgi:hypothetical protein